MVQRRVLRAVPMIALIALLPACAAEKTNAVTRLTESDALRSTLPHDLIGTWTGTFGPAAEGGGGGGKSGQLTLEIKDDASYRLISTGQGGAGTAGRPTTDSGVVVANGRGITLKSSSGHWISLMRSGDALYGVISHLHRGYTIHMSVEKDSGALASPKQ